VQGGPEDGEGLAGAAPPGQRCTNQRASDGGSQHGAASPSRVGSGGQGRRLRDGGSELHRDVHERHLLVIGIGIVDQTQPVGPGGHVEENAPALGLRRLDFPQEAEPLRDPVPFVQLS